MTDLARFLQMMADFGIQTASEKYDDTGDTTVMFAAGDPPVVGYSGFHCDFEFGPDGAFKEAGVWE